ncbi:MAG: putative dioxygenase of extradiol dioxygenase family [Actinomycetia bacterium]|nr:putative dioxygenase of extradiol dioxygenase family [Actinomycetes bacterium]
MDPILHLSLPVRDLEESRHFYVDVLGCERGRERPDFIDVWFYGLQLTLQLRPDQVLPAEHRGVRHFGVTLDASELTTLLTRLATHPVEFLSPVTTDHRGTSHEQTKTKILDPSGNAIELKSYVDPAAAFGHE